jgi:predicted transposase/invertase (TIGR01784 family)
MRFLNPRTDFAFKKIFGSAESSDILLSFLNAVLGLQSPHRIAEVTILDPYLAPRIVGMKDTYVDVQAVDETGRRYIIEMQVLNVVGFEQRVLYNACKTYAGQIASGDDYRLLTDVIALTITDFVMFPGQTSVVNKFKLRADDGAIYSNDLELVFAELPKFTKAESELVDTRDKWLYFLKCAEDLALIPETLNREPSIQHAFNIANRAGLTKEEEDAQTRREIFIQDQRGALEKAAMDGHAKGESMGHAIGHAKGKAEGRAEGEHAASLRIARSLLAMLDDAAIAATTGLDVVEVTALRGR